MPAVIGERLTKVFGRGETEVWRSATSRSRPTRESSSP